MANVEATPLEQGHIKSCDDVRAHLARDTHSYLLYWQTNVAVSKDAPSVEIAWSATAFDKIRPGITSVYPVGRYKGTFGETYEIFTFSNTVRGMDCFAVCGTSRDLLFSEWFGNKKIFHQQNPIEQYIPVMDTREAGAGRDDRMVWFQYYRDNDFDRTQSGVSAWAFRIGFNKIGATLMTIGSMQIASVQADQDSVRVNPDPYAADASISVTTHGGRYRHSVMKLPRQPLSGKGSRSDPHVVEYNLFMS